jgi:hypothetical protein
LILEAFSKTLHVEYGPDRSATQVLHGWLYGILSHPAYPGDLTARVIHTEIQMWENEGILAFSGTSPSGERLLASLYDYCRSYEDWQFRRWLHHLRASDFRVTPGGG